MTIVFILLGALAATLFMISKLGLATPPQEHALGEVAPIARKRSSREDVQLAA